MNNKRLGHEIDQVYDDLSKIVPEYLTLPKYPWMKIPFDLIDRIEHPPIEETRNTKFGFSVFVPKAICIVLKDGGQFWTSGDRTWREIVKKDQNALSE